MRAASQLILSRLLRTFHSFFSVVFPAAGIPSSPASWPTTIIVATPAINPTVTGRESRSAIHCIFAIATTRKMAPTQIASVTASRTYCSLPGTATTLRPAKISGDVVESEPIHSTRLATNRAAKIPAATHAHKPVVGGIPATLATAIWPGIAMAPIVTPARRSRISQLRWYPWNDGRSRRGLSLGAISCTRPSHCSRPLRSADRFDSLAPT